MKKIIMSLALIASFALSGCQTAGDGTGIGGTGINKQLIGAGTGAVLGGLAGSKIGGGNGQLLATGAGAVLGGLVGNSIGKSLDKADLAYAQSANTQAYAAPLGKKISWNNPESGNYGTVTPVRDGRDTSGRYCREYNQTIYVGGQQETATGTACQSANGTWQVQN
jgi:surface antigen